MKITILDGKKFSTIVMNMGEFVDTIQLKFTKEGCSIKAINGSHVCFVNCSIDMDALDYSEAIDGELDVCMDTTFLAKTLKKIGKGEIIFKVNDSDVVVSSVKDDHVRSFTIPLVDIINEIQGLPEINTLYDFKMPVSIFKEILGDVELIKPLGVTFHINNDGMFINSADEFNKKSNIRYTPQDWSYSGEEFSSSFSLDYLKSISKFALNDEITLKFGDNIPGVFGFEDNLQVYNCEFMLAPRMNEGE